MITYGTKVRCLSTGDIGVALGSVAAMCNFTDDFSRKYILVDFGESFSGHNAVGYIGTDTGWFVEREDLEEIFEESEQQI